MATTTTTAPVVRRADLDNSVWYAAGNLASYLLEGKESDGAVGVLELTEWPGGVPPRHIHRTFDEIFYILDGELTIEVDRRRFAAPAGTLAFVPRGTEHGFAVETEQVKMLVIFVPGGSEGGFRDEGRPAEVMALPPHPRPQGQAPIDPATLAALAAKYDTEITGPPVERRE